MYQSKLFTKTRKEAPKDEMSKNAQLLIKAGFINKEMAGVYDYLPLGLRVLKKIENIIREEMNAIGGQEISMTTLQDPELWKKSGRWSDEVVDNWFKSKLANGTEIGLANTHEEPMTQMLKHFVNSYKDFPIYIYQFQNKFRNELRAKSGIMRCREFLMKDLYSFNLNETGFKEFYEKCSDAYLKIFSRCGLGDTTYRTFASGGSFTTGFTDEFQTISESGEDTIYIDKDKKIAINAEIYNSENLAKFDLEKDKLEKVKSIEVGNIFPLGTKYTEALNLQVKNESGENQSVFMGSYGIGLGRLLGTVAEVLSDDKGLVWPTEIAPFKVHLIQIGDKEEVKKTAENLYEEFLKVGVEILFDDRELRPGEKFADSDLLGIPLRIIVSEKTLLSGEYEVKERINDRVSMVKEVDIFDFVKKYI